MRNNLIANALKYTRGRDRAVLGIGSETRNGMYFYFTLQEAHDHA